MAFGDSLKSFAAPATFPRGLAFDGANLWNVDSSTDRVYCIDRNNGAVIRSFTVAAIDLEPRGLTSDGEYLWMSGDQNNRIYCIDPSTGELVDSFPWPAANLLGLGFDGKNLISAGYSGPGQIVWIDRATGAMVRNVASTTRITDLAFDRKDIYAVIEVLTVVDILYKYSIDIELIDRVTLINTYSTGLTFDEKNLWLSDGTANLIYCISVN